MVATVREFREARLLQVDRVDGCDLLDHALAHASNESRVAGDLVRDAPLDDTPGEAFHHIEVATEHLPAGLEPQRPW